MSFLSAIFSIQFFMFDVLLPRPQQQLWREKIPHQKWLLWIGYHKYNSAPSMWETFFEYAVLGSSWYPSTWKLKWCETRGYFVNIRESPFEFLSNFFWLVSSVDFRHYDLGSMKFRSFQAAFSISQCCIFHNQFKLRVHLSNWKYVTNVSNLIPDSSRFSNVKPTQ